MLTETFDRSEEIIRPEMIYGKRKKLCDICIITFSQHVIEYALQKYDCKKVISLESTGGSIPIYIMTYQEKELALYQSMIGAPAAGACLEDVFSPDGIEELHDQLIVARGLNSAGVYLGYPLAISNFAIAAMNLAAELGFDLVDADIVRQVQP